MKRDLKIKSVNSPTNLVMGVASVGDLYHLADGSEAYVDKGTVTNTRKVAGFAANFLKGSKLTPVDPVGTLHATRSKAAHAVREAFDKSIGSKAVTDMTTVTSTSIPKVKPAAKKTPKVSDDEAKRLKRNARKRELRALKKAAA